MRSLLKILLVSFYLLFLSIISWKLFFERSFDTAFQALWKAFRPASSKTLIIGLSEPLVSLDPLANDTASRARLLHMYEGLVRVGKGLQIEPALALSYGLLDDFTWEFHLRPDVFFHDGSKLTLDDVIFSLQQGKNNPASGVKDLAATISKIEKKDEQTLQITTQKPDPLLLQKLSSFLIFSKNAFSKPHLGTGPYALLKNEKNVLSLQRFEKYWGSDRKNRTALKVQLQTFVSSEEKILALKNHTVDLLLNVPPERAKNFQFSGFKLMSIPSLEVNFLMFHFEKTFRSRTLRQAVSLALDTRELASAAQGFAQPATQFVGKGIFGFDPNISLKTPDIKRAEELVKDVSNFSRVKAVLDLPEGLEAFGAEVKKQLQRIGIDVVPQFFPIAELSKKIIQRNSEFFFFGWKADLGDSADFLTAVAHSPGSAFGHFNGGNYRNSEVDRLIELAGETVLLERRLQKLRAAMRKITLEDIIGIPLFSPEVLFAVSEKVSWQPRVDGYMLAQEVKI